MTDDVLLKRIEEIIAPLKQDVSGMKQDMQTVKQDVFGLKQDFIAELEDIQGRLKYLEFAERSLVAFYESLDRTQQELKGYLQIVTIEQQKQGKDLKELKRKVTRINKTVDIIGKSYDERIVKNARDIAEVKEFIGFSQKH